MSREPSTPREPTVFIVDDDPAIRRATSLLLAAARIHAQVYDSAAAFFDAYSDESLGCLLLDISMPGMTGIEVIERLRDNGAHLPVIVVSGTGSIPIAVQGMKLGVIDFLEKPVNPDLLLIKIREALAIDAERIERRAQDGEVSKRFAQLTVREQQLLKLLAQGMSTKQVAGELKIAVKTADNHRTKLMRKTGALNAADLIRLAMVAHVV